MEKIDKSPFFKALSDEESAIVRGGITFWQPIGERWWWRLPRILA